MAGQIRNIQHGDIEMKKIKPFCAAILVVCFFIVSGCDFDSAVNKNTQNETSIRKWTVIVYMAADNDLESAAISDLNELEAVKYGRAPISVLVLLDRSPDYDMTNGNWTDTRLFEVKPDPGGLTSTIISERIDCPELGISKTAETELNTSDPLVLSGLIDFAKRVYPAEHYALFVWGHGTGWRGGTGSDPSLSPVKAIAIDDTSGTYMPLPAFGKAVAGKGLSVIGFDTCYAALLEVVYQIKDDAELFVGSEGAIMSTGWDYTELFNDFLSKPNLTVNDLGDSIQRQFSRQYSRQKNAAISQVKLAEVDNLFDKFNEFACAAAKAADTQQARDTILAQILNNTENYYFTSFPCDLFTDIYDLSKKINAVRTEITGDTDKQDEINAAAANLEEALSLTVPSSWANNGTGKKLAVHVIPLQGIAVPASRHEPDYVRGSMSMNKSAFVENSSNWVPNFVPQNDSLLDKLFYWTY